jgi:hypothetical protein
MRLLLVCLLVTSSTSAFADDDRHDPDTARTLSIVGTAIPVTALVLGLTDVPGRLHWHRSRDLDEGLVVGGALVGLVTPALGELYGHKFVTGGMGLRGVGLLFGLLGGSSYALDSDDCRCVTTWTALNLGIGGSLFLGGAIVDILEAPSVSRIFNEHHLQIMPIVGRDAGIVLGGTF